MEQEKILEAEIAELSKAIEDKRSALAAERGALPPEREVVHQVVSDYVGPKITSAPAQIADDYLNTLDEVSTAKVNTLIATIGERGFKQAITAAKQESPFVLDAFHDALVSHLYEELKSRGVVK